MTTNIIFKIDEKLKKSAMQRAKKEGITLSAFLKSATHDFVLGHLRFGIRSSQEEKAIDRAVAIYEKEKKGGKLRKVPSLSDIG